jgi:hypothetical protein
MLRFTKTARKDAMVNPNEILAVARRHRYWPSRSTLLGHMAETIAVNKIAIGCR